eukprot:TRINITY_DN15406_c0_g1_i1.p1 TRINITY_DN15406_c0_g1~~TRINITY_DN15406_c0_g1_i1.p1  ORF type:complete len:949 (+),score=216.40 TRINITY_DN15406_c0_g1_i1:31-2877(+)
MFDCIARSNVPCSPLYEREQEAQTIVVSMPMPEVVLSTMESEPNHRLDEKKAKLSEVRTSESFAGPATPSATSPIILGGLQEEDPGNGARVSGAFQDLIDELVRQHVRELSELKRKVPSGPLDYKVASGDSPRTPKSVNFDPDGRLSIPPEVGRSLSHESLEDPFNGNMQSLDGSLVLGLASSSRSDGTATRSWTVAQPGATEAAVEELCELEAQNLNMKCSNQKLLRLELRPVWIVSKNQSASFVMGMQSSSASNFGDLSIFCSQGGEAFPMTKAYEYKPGPADPSHPIHIIFDLLGILFLTYDMVSIPMMAFDIQESTALSTIGYTILIYWTLDIMRCFNTGYFDEDGKVVTEKKRIFMRYLRSWLLFDILVVAMDWFSSLLTLVTSSSAAGEGVGILRISKVARVARILRALRLARLAKLRSLLQTLQDMVSSEAVSILLGAAQNVAVLLLLNHVCACIWFYLGAQPGDEREGRPPRIHWVAFYDLTNSPVGYQYLVSLHWTLTQFTPASMSVQPQTPDERLFAVMLVIFAMVSFSTFVSGITSYMTRFRSLTANEMSQRFMMRKYLRENHISRRLATRVSRYVDLALEISRNRTDRKQVVLLNLLSGPLRFELQKELFAPYLSSHRFFQKYGESSSSANCELCATAVNQFPLSRGDTLFDFGVDAKSMYFVCEGNLVFKKKVKKKSSQCIISPKDFHHLGRGTYCTEAVIWMTQWMHRGSCKALIECDILTLDPNKFREVTLAHQDVFVLAKEYALDFLEDLLSDGRKNGVLTDLPTRRQLKSRITQSSNEPENFDGTDSIADCNHYLTEVYQAELAEAILATRSERFHAVEEKREEEVIKARNSSWQSGETRSRASTLGAVSASQAPEPVVGMRKSYSSLSNGDKMIRQVSGSTNPDENAAATTTAKRPEESGDPRLHSAAAATPSSAPRLSEDLDETTMTGI